MIPPSPSSRREFLAASSRLLGSGWLALHASSVLGLAACARDAARTGEPFATLSAAEGATLRALAARIIPSDDGTPGAEEAGAAWFADRMLGSHLADMLGAIRDGLADLDTRAVGRHGAAFASLDAAQQDALVGDVAASEFFEAARMLVVLGTFSVPGLGGNRDGVGYTLLGVEHHAAYSPPFGWYDAEHARSAGGA